MNNLQVKDAINSYHHSSNHDEKPHPTFSSHKERPSSDSPHPYSSEPIPSESADQASLPEGTPTQPSAPPTLPSAQPIQPSAQPIQPSIQPIQPSAQSAPPQQSPSAPQPSLPAVYPIQYYPLYPSNFLFPSRFPPAASAVSPRASSHLDRRRRAPLRLLRFADRRAGRGDARPRALLRVLPAVPRTQHELHDPRRALRVFRVARVRAARRCGLRAADDAVLPVRRRRGRGADGDDERGSAGSRRGAADGGRDALRGCGVRAGRRPAETGEWGKKERVRRRSCRGESVRVQHSVGV